MFFPTLWRWDVYRRTGNEEGLMYQRNIQLWEKFASSGESYLWWHSAKFLCYFPHCRWIISKASVLITDLILTSLRFGKFQCCHMSVSLIFLSSSQDGVGQACPAFLLPHPVLLLCICCSQRWKGAFQETLIKDMDPGVPSKKERGPEKEQNWSVIMLQGRKVKQKTRLRLQMDDLSIKWFHCGHRHDGTWWARMYLLQH